MSLKVAAVKTIASNIKKTVDIENLYTHATENKKFRPTHKFDFDNIKNLYFLKENKKTKRSAVHIIGLDTG